MAFQVLLEQVSEGGQAVHCDAEAENIEDKILCSPSSDSTLRHADGVDDSDVALSSACTPWTGLAQGTCRLRDDACQGKD